MLPSARSVPEKRDYGKRNAGTELLSASVCHGRVRAVGVMWAVSGSFDCASGDEAARRSAQDDGFFESGWGVGRVRAEGCAESEQVGGGYGDRGDGGGFGAEDARAEGDVLPVMGGEEGHLFGCPAAFGAYGQG